MLRSIPPITSTGNNYKRGDYKKKVGNLSKLGKIKMVSGLRGHILGKPINIGDPQTFSCGSRGFHKDTWKPTVHKKAPKEEKLKVGILRDESKDILVDIHDEKNIYQIMVEKITDYKIKDDIIILNKNDSDKEILLPKNVKSETAEIKEKNGILIMTFKKIRKRRPK